MRTVELITLSLSIYIYTPLSLSLYLSIYLSLYIYVLFALLPDSKVDPPFYPKICNLK